MVGKVIQKKQRRIMRHLVGRQKYSLPNKERTLRLEAHMGLFYSDLCKL